MSKKCRLSECMYMYGLSQHAKPKKYFWILFVYVIYERIFFIRDSETEKNFADVQNLFSCASFLNM